MKKDDKLKETAYHEAGHAIMYLAHLKRFRYVTIIPSKNGDILGCVKGYRLSRNATEKLSMGDITFDFAFEALMLAWSGPIAEQMYRGRYSHLGAWGDYENAGDLMIRLTSDTKEQKLIVDWLYHRVRRILKSRWHEVSAVARALLERKKLSCQEVFDIALDATKLNKLERNDLD